jgi:hypothetical protein
VNKDTAPFRGTRADGPTFCWHCNCNLSNGTLRWFNRDGRFMFAKVRDADGNEHRVHGTCVRNAIEDSTVKEVRP